MISECKTKLLYLNHWFTRLVCVFIMIFCSSFKNSYGVDEDYQKRMEFFLDQSGIAKAVSELATFMTTSYIKHHPQQLNEQQVINLHSGLTERLSYDKLKPDLIAFYIEHFKNDEQLKNSKEFTEEISQKFLLTGDIFQYEVRRLANEKFEEIRIYMNISKGN